MARWWILGGMAIDLPENPDGGQLEVLYEKNSVKAAVIYPIYSWFVVTR
jgi:hypothetical protein